MLVMKYTEPRTTVVCDTECYPNYWSIAFRCVDTGRVRHFEQYKDVELDRPAIVKILRSCRIVTFNGINYDLPMIALAMSGVSCSDLKHANDDIIMGGLRPWEFEDKYGVKLPSWLDHVDLMEVSPGSPAKPSLKLYAGRLHSKRMQDLPFDPDRRLCDEEVSDLREYHVNDLEVTCDKYRELLPQIQLRASMSEEYGVDLRSKSDAQVAEAVIKVEIERLTGKRIYKPEVRSGTFYYSPPAYLVFQTDQLKGVFGQICDSVFTVDYSGTVRMPEWLKDTAIVLGESVYRMGIGGLHSSESSVARYSTETVSLVDRDVTSYYPNLILNGQYFPRHLGPVFLEVYRRIYERRLAAKRSGNKNVAETLKIVLNGSFGKFGSPYSTLYSPNLMIQTTIGGQLSVLMLIERLHLAGFSVISANTDGFVTEVPKDRESDFLAIVLDWEWDTGLATEETRYRALFSRDVNNYIAILDGDEVKLKGAFAPAGPGQSGASGMKKNPSCEIAIEAAVAYLQHGTPIEDTIEFCTDVRKFVAVRRVNGGAEKNGEYVGKAIRFYYAVGESGVMTYIANGNSVPRTEGAKPLMELPDSLPDDINYEWYIREAYAILEDVGIEVADPSLAAMRGVFFAHLPEQKTMHLVSSKTGVALCGRRRESIRTQWVAHPSLPDLHRMCGKCKKENAL